MLRLVLSALFIIAAVFTPSAFGQNKQVTPDLEEGMKALGDFYACAIDQVSLSNSKLVLNIPVISFSQRGGKLRSLLAEYHAPPKKRCTSRMHTDTCVETTNRDANNASGGQLYFVDSRGWVAIRRGVNWSEVWSPGKSLHNMPYVSSAGKFESNDAGGFSFNTPVNTFMMPMESASFIPTPAPPATLCPRWKTPIAELKQQSTRLNSSPCSLEPQLMARRQYLHLERWPPKSHEPFTAVSGFVSCALGPGSWEVFMCSARMHVSLFLPSHTQIWAGGPNSKYRSGFR